MAIEKIEKNESIQQQKIAAVDTFLKTLGLDPDHDGDSIAALVEDLATNHANKWLSMLDDIMIEAHMKMDKSLQDAMFYLGDIIADLDKKLIDEEEGMKKKEKKLQKRITDATVSSMRSEWDPNMRRIAAAVGNDAVPDWWTAYEAEQGKFDVVVSQYIGGNVQRIGEILDETKYES